MVSSMMTATQVKAARALLGWRQADLADRSGVSEVSIKNFERGSTDARGSTLSKIERSLEAEGIEFIADGVKFKPKVP